MKLKMFKLDLYIFASGFSTDERVRLHYYFRDVHGFLPKVSFLLTSQLFVLRRCSPFLICFNQPSSILESKTFQRDFWFVSHKIAAVIVWDITTGRHKLSRTNINANGNFCKKLVTKPTKWKKGRYEFLNKLTKTKSINMFGINR